MLLPALAFQLAGCGHKNSDPEGPVDVIEDAEGPIVIRAMPAYRPLTDQFPDPSEILKSPDTAATLEKLRAIASPTMEYYRDLYKLAERAPSLDLAHLNMLLDACYFSYPAYEAMEAELVSLSQANDRPTRVRRAELLRNQNLAMTLAGLHNQILNFGIGKLDTLDLDTAMLLLKRLYKSANSYASFDYVFRRFSPLSQEQKFAIIAIASDKNENTVAATMAMDWFELESDKSVKTLVELASKLKNAGRDRLLFRGLEIIEKVTTDEILLLASAAWQESGLLAGKAHMKTQTFSHSAVLKIGEALVGPQKDIFFDLAMDVYAWMARYHVEDIVKASTSHSAALAFEGSSLMKEFKITDAVEIVHLLSGAEKDKYLLEAVLKVGDLSPERLPLLAAEAFERAEEITAKGNARMRGDFNPRPADPVAPPATPPPPVTPPGDVAPPTSPPDVDGPGSTPHPTPTPAPSPIVPPLVPPGDLPTPTPAPANP